jgi:hypothetical protein
LEFANYFFLTASRAAHRGQTSESWLCRAGRKCFPQSGQGFVLAKQAGQKYSSPSMYCLMRTYSGFFKSFFPFADGRRGSVNTRLQPAQKTEGFISYSRTHSSILAFKKRSCPPTREQGISPLATMRWICFTLKLRYLATSPIVITDFSIFHLPRGQFGYLISVRKVLLAWISSRL